MNTDVMSKSHPREILGVVGGLGPLASAEFLKTIYEYNLDQREQNSPIVMVYSDPTFPARTEAFANGHQDDLLVRLIEALDRLCDLNVSKIVICCVTIHYLLPRVPFELREKVLSLLDVIFSTVEQLGKRHLLICSNETRKWEIFQSHPAWTALQDCFVLPDEGDQRRIGEMILQIKGNRNISGMIPFLDNLLGRYKVDSFIAGCTEMHILAKLFSSYNNGRYNYGCVDPLAMLAKNLGCRSRERVRSL